MDNARLQHSTRLIPSTKNQTHFKYKDDRSLLIHSLNSIIRQEMHCWAGGGLLTLISLTTKSGLHFSHSKLQAWPMIMGDINDCKLFKL